MYMVCNMSCLSEPLPIEKDRAVVEAMRELAEVRAIPVTVKNTRVWVRNDIKGNAAQLFKAIGAPIPPKLLKCAERHA